MNEELKTPEELYPQALEIVKKEGRASTPLLQRKLRIGYVRAICIMDLLETRGIIGPKDGAKPRPLLPPTNLTT